MKKISVAIIIMMIIVIICLITNFFHFPFMNLGLTILFVGAVMLLYILINDNLKNKKAIKTLQNFIIRQTKEYESLYWEAPAFISIRKGPELRYTFVNKTLMDFTKRTDFIGKTLEEVFPNTLNDDHENIINEVYRTGIPSQKTKHKIEYEDAEGHLNAAFFDYYTIPTYDENSEVDGVASYSYDVSDKVWANNETEMGNLRFNVLADSMHHKVLVIDSFGKLQFMNQVWLEFAGISKLEISNFDWRSTVHPDEEQYVNEKWANAVENKTEFLIENRLRRYDGEYRWHITRVLPIKDPNHNIVMWVGSNTEIHNQKIQENQLKEREEYFRTLADETPFMVWKSNELGECVYVNKRWMEFTGLSFEESLGFGFMKAYKVQNEFESAQWIDSISKRVSYEVKYELVKSNGEPRWVLAQANPYFINDDFAGYIGSIVDITEQESAAQALRELLDKKDEFLSTASHELKTPLTTVKAFIQLIERNADEDTKANQYAKKASQNLLRLEKLVNDLLDVSKINADKLTYNETPFDFVEMLHDTVNTMQLSSKKHTIHLNISIPNISYTGDKFRLEQVVYNFLSNAIKYSPNAEDINVSVEIKDNNLVVAVQDFGIGIERQNLEKIFDRYYRVDNTAMKFDGLGLGLYISSEILKRHKGNFWIESEVGKGSIFFFKLPISNTSPQSAKTDNFTYFKNDKVNFIYNLEKKWMESTWLGFQNYDSVTQNCWVLLDLMQKNSTHKILNDNTFVLGDWSEASEWAAQVWFPAMAEAGLKYFAWIYSASTFSQMAAEKSVDMAVGEIIIQFFTTVAEAETWLATKPND